MHGNSSRIGLAYLDATIDRFGRDPANLLQMLIAVQAQAGWLSPDVIGALGERLALPRCKIDGVASFYAFLRRTPPARYPILFSDGITDRMAGSLTLARRLRTAFGLAPDEMSPDGRISVGRTSCIGLADQGPAMLVDGRAIARLDAGRIDAISALIRANVALVHWPRELFHIDSLVRSRGALLGARRADESPALSQSTTAEQILDAIEQSGLRGRGGAGFATATKWRACRAAAGVRRHVVCNADEGEPGTFKDRVLLVESADLVIEGMTACARAIGAQSGRIYLRGEYAFLLPHLESVLAARRVAGLLGPRARGVLGIEFDVQVHLGAGAYVCGEESALLESLEGRRGTPRIRPPYPVTFGYRGEPTVVNNVETFACAALVLRLGTSAFATMGTSASTGPRLLSVSGDCERPGVYEMPFGVSVAEVLAMSGASDVQAVQVGGAAGHCIAPAGFTRRLCFEDLAGAGSLTIFGMHRDMFEVARAYTHFFAHESCGLCTPCRVGTTLLARIMNKLHDGRGSSEDLSRVESLHQVMKGTSHCGLGRGACVPVLEGLERFRPAFERRWVHAGFVPGVDLEAALEGARAVTHRDDAGAHLETPR